MEGPFNDPGIAQAEQTSYRVLVGGEEAGTGWIGVEPVSREGLELYEQTVRASLGENLELRAAVVFRRRSGTIHAEEYRMQMLDGGQRPVADESSRFRGVKVPQFGGEVGPHPRDLAPLLGCALALRGLDFEPGARRGFTAWIAGNVTWEVEARVEKQEAVELPVGEQSAWRVRLRPSFERVDNALDKLIDALMPPLVAHLAHEPPHRLLRFEFPTGPFRENPPGLIEATELGG